MSAYIVKRMQCNIIGVLVAFYHTYSITSLIFEDWGNTSSLSSGFDVSSRIRLVIEYNDKKQQELQLYYQKF